jgi:hypothetical protein
VSKQISAEEVRRLERARAVARRTALREAAEWCDAITAEIEKENPGKRKGSISIGGHVRAAIAKRCGDKIWSECSKIEVPDA